MADRNLGKPFEMPPSESKEPLRYFEWILNLLSDDKLQTIIDKDDSLQGIAALNILNGRKKQNLINKGEGN